MNDASGARRCKAGHEMTISSRFRFDHEPGDTAHETLRIASFAAMGLELGADVTVWYCATCDVAEADFVYPEKGP